MCRIRTESLTNSILMSVDLGDKVFLTDFSGKYHEINARKGLIEKKRHYQWSLTQQLEIMRQTETGEKAKSSLTGHQDINNCQRNVIGNGLRRSSTEDKEEVKINEVFGVYHGEFKLIVQLEAEIFEGRA